MGSQATSTAYTAFTGKTILYRAQGSNQQEQDNIIFPYIYYPCLNSLILSLSIT